MTSTSSRSWRDTGAVVVLVAAADQATKSLATHGGRLPVVLPLLNPGLSLELVRAGRWPETLAMALGVVAAVALLLPRVRSGAVPALTAGLLLGGALSNLADRALFGAVRDFLVLGPVVANLADVAVVAGLVLLARDLLYVRSRRTSRPADLESEGG
jgi:lipoprotein signal peptidase